MYLAFVEDEVSHVAEALVKEHPEARILAVSADYDGVTLFGKSMTAFTRTKPDRALVDDKKLKAASPASAFALTLKEQGLDGQNLEVVDLSRPDTKKSGDAIVIIRSPVHGKYPEALESFFDRAIRSVQKLPEAAPSAGGLSYASLGTAGGIREDRGPGTSRAVGASLFVGSEFVPSGKKDVPGTYRSVIRGADGKAISEFYTGPEFKTRDEAEADAETRLSTGPSRIHEWVQARSEKGADTTLTTSFFAGARAKQAGAALGLSSVNMEDYHVLSILGRSAVPAQQRTIERIVADPAHIPAALATRVHDWARDTRYTADQYVDALQWGLEGTPLTRVPESAGWKAFAGLPASDVTPFYAPVPGSSPPVVLDPFFGEIARKLLNELASGSAFSDPALLVPPESWKKLSEPAQKEFRELLKAKGEALKKSADAVFTAFARKDPAFRTLARALMAQARSLELPSGPLSRELASRSVALLGAPDGNYEVWVNSYRWERTAEFRLSRIGGKPGLADSAIDRTSYRSALFTLLPESGARFARRISDQWNARRLDGSLGRLERMTSEPRNPCPGEPSKETL